MTQRRKVWLKVCVNHQFSSYSLDDVFNLKKKLDMIFITLKHFLMISHTNITYLLDHFSKRSYLCIFRWRLGRARRPVWNWFHFFGKLLEPRETLGKLAVGTYNLEGRLPPLVAGSRPCAGRTWWNKRSSSHFVWTNQNEWWPEQLENIVFECTALVFFCYPALVLWGPVSNLL